MPAGFKRSRALWDETIDGGLHAWVSAICYELQPIRLSVITSTFKSLNLYQYLNRKQVDSIFQYIHNIILVGIPWLCNSIFSFIIRRSLKQWMFVGVVLIYYYFIRWIHEMLDAGPVVIIITALTLIFTIGLSDDENRSGLSAYSVFNKGFEQLMGSIDADSLLAQHVGGGMAGAGAMMNNNNNNNNNNNRNHNNDDHDRDNRNNDEVVHPHRQLEVADDEMNANANANADNNNNNNNNENDNNRRARKSGKKARRDQKREERRRLGLDLDLDGDDIDGPDNPGVDVDVDVDGVDDIVMQRIIEEQIAAENER